MSEFMKSLPDSELYRIHEETNGGEYLEARHLLDAEMARRCLNLCDNPTGFVDALDEV